ncbi:MAG: S49 family peptidase, partial [Candidatus Diapherotrites archaeon]|nr:S49 family peptidase [Candidatus Diapherotrites archaeon]
PNVKELLDEFGVKFGIIRSGNLKALPNPFEELDEEQKKIVEEMVQESFLQFKADILSFREGKISLAELEKISDGRILSGKEALKLHLVDGLLSRDKAILRAGEIMGVLGKPSIKEYSPKGISLFDLLAASGRAFASGFKSSFDFSTAPSFQS